MKRAWLIALACVLACGDDGAVRTGDPGPPAATGDAAARDAATGDASPGDASAARQPDAMLDARTATQADGASAANVQDASSVDATVGDAGAPRSCKRGVSYNNEKAADSKAFGKSIGWWYDWSATPNADATRALEAAGVEFVPMIWTGPPRANIDVQGLITSIPRSARYLLGFNEPNFGAQANLTPEQAAAAWPQLEQIARARDLKLVSPAVNYCGGSCNQTDPFKWLDAFFAACKGCQVDYVAFHWYACSLDALKTFVERYASKYGKPLWLTEFSCLDDPGDHSAAGQLAYLKQAVPFLEGDARVFRYAWFIGRSSKPSAYDLFADPGALTTLGSAYGSAAGTCQ